MAYERVWYLTTQYTAPMWFMLAPRGGGGADQLYILKCHVHVWAQLLRVLICLYFEVRLQRGRAG